MQRLLDLDPTPVAPKRITYRRNDLLRSLGLDQRAIGCIGRHALHVAQHFRDRFRILLGCTRQALGYLIELLRQRLQLTQDFTGLWFRPRRAP